MRVAWYASDDGSGSQLDTADSPAVEGGSAGFEAVSTGPLRAPEAARSARLRLVLRPASGGAPAALDADDASFAPSEAPPPAPEPTPEATPPAAVAAAPGAAAVAEGTPPASDVVGEDGEASAAADAPAAASTPDGAAPVGGAAFALRVTALLPNPVQPGQDAEYEWVELTNVGRTPLRLGGFVLRDNAEEIALPDVELPAGGSIVVAGASAELDGAIALRLAGGLFNGLANGGDRLALFAPGGALVDALSWGADASYAEPPLDAPAPGQVLRRRFAPDGAPLPAEAAPAAAPSGGATPAGATPGAEETSTPPPSGGDASGGGGAGRAAWIALATLAAVSLGGVFAFRFRDLLRGGE